VFVFCHDQEVSETVEFERSLRSDRDMAAGREDLKVKTPRGTYSIANEGWGGCRNVKRQGAKDVYGGITWMIESQPGSYEKINRAKSVNFRGA